jgi:hypothetical protein
MAYRINSSRRFCSATSPGGDAKRESSEAIRARRTSTLFLMATDSCRRVSRTSISNGRRGRTLGVVWMTETFCRRALRGPNPIAASSTISVGMMGAEAPHSRGLAPELMDVRKIRTTHDINAYPSMPPPIHLLPGLCVRRFVLMSKGTEIWVNIGRDGGIEGTHLQGGSRLQHHRSQQREWRVLGREVLELGSSVREIRSVKVQGPPHLMSRSNQVDLVSDRGPRSDSAHPWV